MRQPFEDRAELRRLDDASEGRSRSAARSVAEVLEERTVPQLNGRIDPCRVASQRRQRRSSQGHTVGEDPSRACLVPAKQQADKRRLAGTGAADDRDVLSRVDRETDVLEDRASRRQDANLLERHGDALRLLPRPRPSTALGTRRHRRWFCGLRRFRLVGCAQGFKQPAQRVALRRVLPDAERDLAAERGNAERPVNEEERAARIAAARDVAEHEPRGEAETDDRLQPFHHHAGREELESRACPLDEQCLVAAADCAFCAVRSSGDKAEQRVQIEPVHGRRVIAFSELALGQYASACQGNAQREDRRAGRGRRACGIEPDQTARSQNELCGRSNEPRAQIGQAVQGVQRMGTLGHV